MENKKSDEQQICLSRQKSYYLFSEKGRHFLKIDTYKEVIIKSY
jgi:hypothetical protein